jgi:hypothetical protein
VSVAVAVAVTVIATGIRAVTRPGSRVELDWWASLDLKTGPCSVADVGRVEILCSAKGMGVGGCRSLQEVKSLCFWTGEEGMLEVYLRNRHVAGRFGEPGVVDRGTFEGREIHGKRVLRTPYTAWNRRNRGLL